MDEYRELFRRDLKRANGRAEYWRRRSNAWRNAAIAMLVLYILFGLCGLAYSAPADQRADVNQDGCVNAADLLIVRDPSNWQQCVATPAPTRTVVSYSGPPESTAYDVRTSATVLANLDIRSTQRGIVADEFWGALGVQGLLIEDCTVNSHSYGLYSGISGVTVLRTTFNAAMRDPVRITNGSGYTFEDCTFSMPQADVAVRIHGSASNITFRRCTFYCYSWGVDIGEQYRGAGGCVRDVTFEECTFIASEHTIHAVRIRGQNVTLLRCRGIGFDKALSGATFATAEKHSCEPTGARLIGCTVDGGKPLLKGKWKDTEVR